MSGSLPTDLEAVRDELERRAGEADALGDRYRELLALVTDKLTVPEGQEPEEPEGEKERRKGHLRGLPFSRYQGRHLAPPEGPPPLGSQIPNEGEILP